ncbi:hypothetical protein BDZ91DRAFT_712801 [Kalaharituber pfeilii]|nr:hypothetical protein BDZ91DRAFT_712801 [Kalaharituber pfeilii]
MYKQRTTSFLEQDHSAKARVKKQRNKRQSIAKALQVPKPNSSAAPRPVSTKTKDKLDTFAFKKPTPLSTPRTSSQGASTENGADQSRNNNDNENERKHESTLVPNLVEDGYSSPGKEPPKTHTPSRVCPQTPAPRLPLKDLVKTSEDGKPPFSNVTSPEERIVWQVSPRSTPHAASQITPVPKRKRARSSSPIGSPMAAVTPVSEQLASHRGPKKPPKTPHADPANDVWQRYSSTSNVRPANQPLLARLLSGETPKGLNLSPLRRSYSCGPDWPPARLKRRRTTSTETENQDAEELDKAAEDGEVAGPATCQGRQRVVKSRINRVNMLLDKVHEKLAKSSTPPELTTSSPTRENDGSFYMPSSPTKNATSRRGVHNVPSKIKTAVKPQVASDSEDYDDFDGDLDFEMLDKVEEVAVAFTQQNQKGTKAAKDSTIPQVFDFDEFDFDEGDEALSGIDVDKLVLNHDRVFEKPTRLISVQPQAINGIVQVATQDAAEVVAEFRDVDFDDWDDEELESSI